MYKLSYYFLPIQLITSLLFLGFKSFFCWVVFVVHRPCEYGFAVCARRATQCSQSVGVLRFYECSLL